MKILLPFFTSAGIILMACSSSAFL